MESNLATQITDLNIDCLEKIFRYLDDWHLLIIADCLNKHLKSAADLVFTLRNGKKLLEIYQLFPYRPQYDTLTSFPHKMITGNFQLSLKMLRCFGHLLSKLHIDVVYNADKLLVGHFVTYVKKYLRCEGLHEFRFRSQPNVLDDLLNSVEKPFSNAECVGIVGGTSIKKGAIDYLISENAMYKFLYISSERFR